MRMRFLNCRSPTSQLPLSVRRQRTIEPLPPPVRAGAQEPKAACGANVRALRQRQRAPRIGNQAPASCRLHIRLFVCSESQEQSPQDTALLQRVITSFDLLLCS